MGANALKILKRDAVGRVSYRAKQREAILDEFERSRLKGATFARITGLQYQIFASWIQRRRHERGDYQMAAPALKASRRPVPGVRLMEAVLAGPVYPEADGGLALRVELRCGTQPLVGDDRQAELAVRDHSSPCLQRAILSFSGFAVDIHPQESWSCRQGFAEGGASGGRFVQERRQRRGKGEG
jgi:hypothetical protein